MHQTAFWEAQNIVRGKLYCAHLKMKGSFPSTWFDLWFLKKASWGACFFTVVHACTKNLNEANRGTLYQNFSFFQPLNYLHIDLWLLLVCILIYLQKAEMSKHSWKKIMQLLRRWNVFTKKNVEHGIEHDIDSSVYRVCVH